MSDKDPFSFQFNKNTGESSQVEETSLITLERSQKLDLLIHLISNLRQSLVICGPEGIGKTTLLNEFKERKNNVWPIVTLQSSEDLSFETLQKKILQFLIQASPKFKNEDLSSALSILDKQGQKIVVLIDNAGQLVPGLISNIIQYATASESLRIVFALTQDELHLKNSSDKSINDCHFIEIPPLTEKQCGIFLQNLSSKPNAVVSINAVNEQLVEKVYRQTHGIPGKIKFELPKITRGKESSGYLWLVGAFLVSVLIAAGLKFSVFNQSNKKVEKEVTFTVDIKKPEEIKFSPLTEPTDFLNVEDSVLPEVVEFVGPIKPEIVDLIGEEGVEKVVDKKSVFVDKKENELIQKKPLKEEASPSEAPLINNEMEEVKTKATDIKDKQKAIVEEKDKKPAPIIEKKQEKIKDAAPKIVKKLPVEVEGKESQWIFQQPKQNYTIQLMVLSKRKSAEAFLVKNKPLQEQLKFFRLNKKSEKYVLIYGSFKNFASASKQMKSLPAKYKKSWIRRIKAVQREIKK